MSKPNQVKRKSSGGIDLRPAKKSRIPWSKISSSLPKFLDAETSVTAAKFGARRLPEIKSLWRTFVLTQSNENKAKNERECVDNSDPLNVGMKGDSDVTYFESGGCKISQRHMRRRASSHNSRKRHRYPNNTATQSHTEEKFIPLSSENMNKKQSRKARRKPSSMKDKHCSWKKNMIDNDQFISNWLETHLWHTKRFHMTSPLTIFNNWCIPLGHTNRGSKAALRLVKNKSTIQDATWSIGGRVIKIESENKDSLLNILEKVCGGKRNLSAPFLLDKRVLAGLEVGHGFFYALDCTFPSEIIGPGQFTFGNREKEKLHCNIIVDVTIAKNVFALIETVAKSTPVTVNLEPLALLKIRGGEATDIMLKSNAAIMGDITIQGSTELKEKWEALITKDGQSHTKFKHGTIFHLRSKEKEQEITLISQCPNEIKDDKSNVMNIGVSGWDIWCNPTTVTELFMSINQNGACPIGFIESATIAMEADPPLPLWPRDFPDSKVGMEYWSGQSPEWDLIRYCVEGGMDGGRIKTTMYRLMKKCSKTESSHNVVQNHIETGSPIHNVEWHTVCKSDKLGDERKPIIVIKGPYVMPFIQTLAGWCPKKILESYYVTSKTKKKEKRRPRRKLHDPKIPITLPPLSKERAKAQKEKCLNLLKSLSMFALLRCHIKAVGRGKICSGMKISCCDDNNTIMGIVVAGMFSPSRGAVHGVGFVSSKAFLEALSENNGNFIAFHKEENSFVFKVSMNLSDGSKSNDTVGYLQILSE